MKLLSALVLALTAGEGCVDCEDQALLQSHQIKAPEEEPESFSELELGRWGLRNLEISMGFRPFLHDIMFFF